MASPYAFAKVNSYGTLLSVTAAAAPGPVSVTICASDYAGDCCGVFTDTIQVKFCRGTAEASDFFVYRLKNVPFCDMAYCAVGSHGASNSTNFQRCLLITGSITRRAQRRYFRYLGAILSFFDPPGRHVPVRRADMLHHAKFCADRFNRCREMADFLCSRWRPSAILDISKF